MNAPGRLVSTPLGLRRVRAGFQTAQEAADRLECSRIHLLNIERGRCGASSELMTKMALLYKCSEAQIVRDILRGKKALLERSLEAMK